MPKSQTTTVDRVDENGIRAARIRAARAFADLSQTDVAQCLGVSNVSVKRMERGQRDIRLEDLQAIAKLCKVPLAFMVDGWPAVSAPTVGADLTPVLHAIDQLRAELLDNADGRHMVAENAASMIATDAANGSGG